MLDSFSGNAIASKARAMYGRRLTAGDYGEMMKKGTVAEVATYLRDNTHYGDTLTQLTPESVSRGRLEELLRSLRYHQYAALTRYSFAGEGSFYAYLFLWDEIEQIIRLLRHIGGGSEGEYTYTHSAFLARHCSYNLNALLACRDYPSLLEALADSDYYKILEKYPPRSDEGKNQIDLVLCERELRLYYFQRVHRLIEKEFSGDAARALWDLFLAQIDAENLVDAYRLRRFFKSSPEQIRQALLPFKTPSRKLIDQIVDCSDAKELPQLLAGSRLLREGELDQDYIESLTLRQRERVSRKQMRYSTHPPVTLVCYMTQLEIELGNVVNIIEGIRYGLSPPDIKKLLILS